MKQLITEAKKCTICKPFLEFGVNPIFTADKKSKIIIIGQAPGNRVHTSNIPWNDKSGDTLRSWLDMAPVDFYNEEIVSLLPMGFCYPGKGKTGDLPPRKECAPFWHEQFLSQMTEVKLILLVGKYAQDYYLKTKKTLTSNVNNFQDFLPQYFPLPHPSPRNNIWMKKNPWFNKEVVPTLKFTVNKILSK